MENKNICTCNEECTCEDCQCTEENNCSDECNCANDKIDENLECTCDDCECEEECESLIYDETEEFKKKIIELEDSLLRSKADFINYRKRLEEEQIKLFKYCNEDLIKEILPIIDNFERAIDLDDNNLDDELSKFLSGFKMIYCNLLNTLKKYEVIEIDGINKPFDATYHEAVLTEKVKGTKSGMVIEVLQKGYLLKGKVIRPAMVKVSE